MCAVTAMVILQGLPGSPQRDGPPESDPSLAVIGGRLLGRLDSGSLGTHRGLLSGTWTKSLTGV